MTGNDMPGQDCAQAFPQNFTLGRFDCGMKWVAHLQMRDQGLGEKQGLGAREKPSAMQLNRRFALSYFP